MLSAFRRGSSGLVTLGYHGQRLAYLQLDREEPRVPKTQDLHSATGASRTQITGYTRGQLVLKFYELWNLPVWATLVITHGGPTRSLIQALQRALIGGDLSLVKILKSPTGSVQAWEYQLAGCTLESLANDPEQVTISGVGTMAKTLRLTPCPPSTMSTMRVTPASVTRRQGFTPPVVTSGHLSAAPAPAGDQELPEIQVARYALRSFNLHRGNLGSLFQSGNWNGGGARATCKQVPRCANPPSPDPHRCGLYGTLTLEQLEREYGQYAPHCVAVFAAEGRTMLGTKGLRTAAARIVAYWCRTGIDKAVFDTHAPAAQHFERIEDLLAAYRFPAWHGSPRKFPHYQEVEAPPVVRQLPAAPPVTPAPSGLVAGRRQGKSQALVTAATQAQLAGMLSAATPDGLAALSVLLGVDLSAVPSAASTLVTLRCGKCTALLSACSCSSTG